VRANPSKAYMGTSAEVMGEIAKAMDFKLITNMTTNDKMNWLPGRKTWNGYAEMICKHGHVNDTSALHIGVDQSRNLHYKDVTQLFSTDQVKKVFYYGQAPQKGQAPLMAVEQYKANNHSGLLNNLAGYGLRISQSNITTGLMQKFTNVKALKINNLVDINKAVLGQIGTRGRIDLTRLFTGNTHPNMMLASHQNQRIKATYSQEVHVLVSQASGVNLFDMVQFSAITSQSADDSVSGLYCVTAISKAIKNRRYKEKIQLTSAGPQNGNSLLT
jgi:hypothetical protein